MINLLNNFIFEIPGARNPLASKQQGPGIPCKICSKKVSENRLQCEICDGWTHSSCMGYTKEEFDFLERGRDISSPAIWATKLSAHFGDNNVAQMSRQICSHTPSALNAGAKRSGATCHMAMPQCYYLAKGAKRPSHTTNMLTSFNISVN